MSSPVEFAGNLAVAFIQGEFGLFVEAMSAELAAALPPAELREVRGELASTFGDFKGAQPAIHEEHGGIVMVRAPVSFERGAVELKMSFRSGRMVGFFIGPHQAPAPVWSCPDYADPGAFTEIDVNFAHLPATLTLPARDAPAPAVLLIHGSGPQDRDATLGPNRPFRDLAWGLATRGIAVLRYEKRTRARPEDFAAIEAPTVKEEVLDDVALALQFLRERLEVDPRRIVALGHSLGGMLGPRIAADNPGLGGLVLMAAAARPLPDITVEQFTYLASLRPPDAEGERRLNEIRAEAQRVKTARPGDSGAPFLGAPLSYWADLNVYDPVAVAATLTLPVLALQGGRDYQVTEADFRLFSGALRDKPGFACRLFPRFNHLMMAGEGRSTPQDYELPRHVDLEVIETIAAFARSLEVMAR